MTPNEIKRDIVRAIRESHREELDKLLRDAPAKMVQDRDLIEPLAAASDGLVVRRMLNAGFVLHCEDVTGRSALWYAVENGNLVVVEELLDGGADPDSESSRTPGATPLFVAVHNGDLRLVRALLKAGATANKRGNNGRTPLHWAMLRCGLTGDCEVVDVLLAAGADPSAQTDTGWTPDAWRSLIACGRSGQAGRSDHRGRGQAIDLVDR